MKIAGLIDEKYVNTVIRTRPRDIHKGDCGKILIIAGSQDMAGAAVFASKAAMKTGSGLAKVCTDQKIFPVIQISVPEAICIKWDAVREDLRQYDCIAIGPGMGVGRQTKEMLETVLTHYHQTIVIDADGLNAVSEEDALQKMVRESVGDIIITPHIGEAERLLGYVSLKGKTKLEIASLLMARYKAVTVLKGFETLVAISDEEAYTNTTGNPGMATAGSGDVLTGIITSLAGQGLAPSDAARAGVFVHGLSGDLAADEVGEYGLVASDIAEHTPFAMKKLTD